MMKIQRRKSIYISVGCTFVLMLLSVIYVVPTLRSGVIPLGDDLAYNVNRIQNLSINLLHGNWYPYIYTYRFNHIPNPLGIFYPQVTTLPFAIFCLIVKNDVIGICLGFAFYTFVAMEAMYWVVRRLGKSQVIALVSAVTYGFSTYRAVTMVTRADVGEFIAMSFVPIVLYGLYRIMGNQSGVIALGFGLSLILMSHVLSAILCVIFLIIEFMILIPEQEHWRRTLITLLKSVGVFIASSLIWLVPIVEQELFQKFVYPQAYDLSKNSPSLTAVLTSSLNNTILFTDRDRATIGIILVLTIIWGALKFRQLDHISQYSLVLGVAILLVSTSLFPWGVVMHTPLKMIQFSFRLLMFSTVFLSLIAGEMLQNLCMPNQKSILRSIKLAGIILLIIVPWYSSMKSYMKSDFRESPLRMTPGKVYIGGWQDDYTPQKIVPKDWLLINDHAAMVNGHQLKIHKIIDRPNGFIYIDDRFREAQVTLPAMMYKNVQLWSGGHQLKVNARGMVHIKGTKSNIIEYRYVPSIMDKLAEVVSVGTWGILIGWIMISLIRRSKG